MRAFAKEKAACDKYQAAVNGVLKYGLKSAAASGFFFGTNFAFATGKLIPAPTMPVKLQSAASVSGNNTTAALHVLTLEQFCGSCFSFACRLCK